MQRYAPVLSSRRDPTHSNLLTLIYNGVVFLCCICTAVQQWLFIVEGIPSVLLGMATYWLLPSHPLWDAWMLTPAEREALHLRVGVIL
jgi:predicted membrane metal-binding protein